MFSMLFAFKQLFNNYIVNFFDMKMNDFFDVFFVDRQKLNSIFVLLKQYR